MCFHSYSKWCDVLVFRYAGSYLLQGRKCKKCHCTKFRIVRTTPIYATAQCDTMSQDSLVKAGLWSAAEKDESPKTIV